MSGINLKAMCLKVTTDVSGIASISVKIPGTLTTLDGFLEPTENGRYLRGVKIWSESGGYGDLICNLRVEDTDEKLQSVLGMTLEECEAIFPDYPILNYMVDDDFIETSDVKKGFWVNPNEPIQIVNLDQQDSSTRGLLFVASELYICADFISASGASGKRAWANFVWGKME